MPVLIPSGTSQTVSADFTINAGDPGRTVFLTDDFGENVAARSVAWVQIKSAAGRYFNAIRLTSEFSVKSVRDAGTYRVARVATDVAFGIEIN